MEPIRLQKIISERSSYSRRKAEELIADGKVKVNGHPAKLGDKARPGKDIITVEGERLASPSKRKLYYLMLNKPRGYVTTMRDEKGRRCITELLEDIPERVYPIGRLDRVSEGLLLLTNDGGFANDIMHPSRHVGKTYRVTIHPDVTEEQLAHLSVGVEIDGEMTAPASVIVLTKQPGRVVLQMVIHEGRNRQIRKMCEAVGLEVGRLKRTAVGPVKLGMLKPGTWRELTNEELRALRNAITKPEARRND